MWRTNYAPPIYRMATTFFVDIFTVGFIILLIAAVLLRNSRFLLARAAA